MIEADDLRAARLDVEYSEPDREGFVRVRRTDLLDIIALVCRQDEALKVASAARDRPRFALRIGGQRPAPIRRKKRR